MAEVSENQQEPKEDFSRTLGRIEGVQEQILRELQKIHDDFKEHKADDTKNFSAIKLLMFQNVDILDSKLALLTRDRDLARGAGMVLFALFGLLATIAGSWLSSILRDWLKL